MKKMKLLLLLSAAVCSLAVIISCSRNDPKKNRDEGKREVMSDRKDIEKDSAVNLTLPASTYIMRLEDKTLTLYEISGSKETPVSAVVIDPAYYPVEDIQALNKGVVAYSKEDGFARLENFTN